MSFIISKHFIRAGARIQSSISPYMDLSRLFSVLQAMVLLQHFFIISSFLKIKGRLLYIECPSTWVCLMFSNEWVQLFTVGRKATEQSCPSGASHRGRGGQDLLSTCFMLVMRLWSKDVVSKVSPWKSYYFPLVISNLWAKVLWDYVQFLVLIKFSLTCFDIHWSFLRKSIIIVIVTK